LAARLDLLIAARLVSGLEDADVKVPVATGDAFAALDTRRRELQESRRQLAIDHYRLHLIERDEYLAAREGIEADLATITRKLDRATTNRHVKELPVGDIAQDEWDAHADDLAWRRELIRIILGDRKIMVKPSKYGRQPPPYHPHFGAWFDPDDIESTPPLGPPGPDAVAQLQRL